MLFVVVIRGVGRLFGCVSVVFSGDIIDMNKLICGKDVKCFR